MEMIDRYVYAVIKRLPPKQRSDIDKELRSLIEDMLAARTGGAEPTAKDIEAVLLEMGEPSKVAANYLNAKQYLISPAMYDTYFLVMKIVLACVAFGITVAMIVGVISNPQNMIGVFAQWFASLLSALLSAFGSVTLVFAIMDRIGNLSEHAVKFADDFKREFRAGMNNQNQNHKQVHQEPWRPHDLPHVPREDARIRPSEPIFAIAFTILWLVVINFAPWVIGGHVVNNTQYTFIPFFALDVLRNYLVFINVLGLFGIAIEIAKLFTGTWNIPIALAKVVHNVFSALLFVNMFTNPALIDGSFFTKTGQAFNFPADAATVMSIMDSVFFKIFFFVVLFGLIVDCITTLYKGIRGAVRT